MLKRCAGFTIIELVTVMILIGIIAAMAIPRMPNANDFRALAFHDSVVAALRYAQKTATSHRRQVCATYTKSSVTLTIETVPGGGCGTALPLSNGNPSVTSPDSTNINFGAVAPAGMFFQPDGRIFDKNGAELTTTCIGSGAVAVTAVGATGYVK